MSSRPHGEGLPIVLAAVALAGVLGVLTVRAFDAPWAFVDFRDTIHYPTRTWLDGGNPYDAVGHRERHPDAKAFPPFAPLSLPLYAAYGALERRSAEAAWYATSIALTFALAVVVLRTAGTRARPAGVLAVATLLLASRPGQMNLLLGQHTLPLVLGAAAALVAARARPVLAAIGIAIATIKPQFGLPLAALTAAGGDVAVAVGGALLAAATSLGVLYGMPPAAGRSALGTYAAAFDASAETIDRATTVWWSRVDLPYLAHHIVGTSLGEAAPVLSVVVLGIGMLAMRARRTPEERVADELRIGIACLTLLLCVYHQAYDTLLLALPLALLVRDDACGAAWRAHPALRWTTVALLTFPAVNYLATWSVIERLGLHDGAWRVVTALNAAALTVAWALHLTLALRPRISRHDAAAEVR